MSDNKEVIEAAWELTLAGGGPIADTGDYDDGQWELHNNRTVLYCSSDTLNDLDEDEVPLRQIVDILNENSIDLEPDTSREFVLCFEKQELERELTELRQRVNGLKSLSFEEWYGNWQGGKFWIFESNGDGMASGETVLEALAAFESITAEEGK